MEHISGQDKGRWGEYAMRLWEGTYIHAQENMKRERDLTFISWAATIAARRRVKESLCFQSTGIVAVTWASDLVGEKGW